MSFALCLRHRCPERADPVGGLMAAEGAVFSSYPSRMIRRECGVKDSVRQTQVSTFLWPDNPQSGVIGHLDYVQSPSYQ